MKGELRERVQVPFVTTKNHVDVQTKTVVHCVSYSSNTRTLINNLDEVVQAFYRQLLTVNV